MARNDVHSSNARAHTHTHTHFQGIGVLTLAVDDVRLGAFHDRIVRAAADGSWTVTVGGGGGGGGEIGS